MDEIVTIAKSDESTTQFDADFRRVDGLTWLPWAGQNYSERPSGGRLLIVGESHYFRGNTPEEQRADREGYKDPQSTRIMVVERGWGAKTFTNIPKLFFKTTEIDHARFWADTAYYNFIQQPMDYNRDGGPERPAWNQFVEGWRVFAEVVRVIQPSHCLFIGVEAAKSFNFSSITCTQQVGRTWARTARLDFSGKSVQLIFVQHLGKYFSWSQWHDYLQTQHPEFMLWLGAESYATESQPDSKHSGQS